MFLNESSLCFHWYSSQHFVWKQIVMVDVRVWQLAAVIVCYHELRSALWKIKIWNEAELMLRNKLVIFLFTAQIRSPAHDCGACLFLIWKWMSHEQKFPVPLLCGTFHFMYSGSRTLYKFDKNSIYTKWKIPPSVWEGILATFFSQNLQWLLSTIKTFSCQQQDQAEK